MRESLGLLWGPAVVGFAGGHGDGDDDGGKPYREVVTVVE